MAPLRQRTDDGRRRSKAVRVGRSRTGKGVFAARRYRSGDIIGEIKGTVIGDADYGSQYCFDLGGTAGLEPVAPFRYINHSCEPNCWYESYAISGDIGPSTSRRLYLFAACEIKPGDELTIDYAWKAEGAMRCRCNTSSCRGWIVAEDELEQVPLYCTDEKTVPQDAGTTEAPRPGLAGKVPLTG